MSYLSIATGNMVPCPAGILNIGRVHVAAFDLQESAVTVAMWKAFQKEYAGQPYARFVQAPEGDLILTHMGRSEEALRDVPVAVVPGEPVPLSQVVKVVPTQQEYEERFRDNEAGARQLFLDDDHPVVLVNRFEAAAYAVSIGGRLPTRVEREYAARAGRQGKDICGVGGDGRLRADNAWWSGPNYHPGTAKKATTKVRSFEPTPWGHYDLAGNVWEWVAFEGALQGSCGGSWADGFPEDFLAAYCYWSNPDDCFSGIGFRVARSLPQELSG